MGYGSEFVILERNNDLLLNFCMFYLQVHQYGKMNQSMKIAELSLLGS